MKKAYNRLYKTIRALRFFANLFDTDTGKVYRLVTSYSLSKSGYFLIKQTDRGEWLVVKEAPIVKNERYDCLPYLTRLKLYQFLAQNYGFSKRVQKVIDSLDL